MTDRPFHVVLWGATGFTGRLVAEYLCAHYGVGGELRWALAGRSEGKLEALRAELGRIDAAAASIPILIGDSMDGPSLEAIASKAAVVCTTVGPYSLYGAALVAACVESGADYCDLTGETPFIRDMIDKHHDDAARAGRRIVHCCGFDSIPSDIGVFALQEAAIARFGAPLTEVTFYLGKSRGSFSGGTVASMLEIMKLARDPEVRKMVGDPYALNPRDAPRGEDRGDRFTPRYDARIGGWTGPFVMGPINTRIVRRSNALMGSRYGEGFRYSEVMIMPPGPLGWVAAQALTLVLGAFVGLAATSAGRKLLEATVLPAPGEGPDEEARERGFFNVRIVGTGEVDGEAVELEVTVKGKRDPGYGATARMLSEAAIALSLEASRLPERYGVLTPASAMGEVLLERLERADVRVEVS